MENCGKDITEAQDINFPNETPLKNKNNIYLKESNSSIRLI
jgi:hypothetical protein